MPDTAFIQQFKDEYVAGFEQSVSVLKSLVNNDVMTKGNQATWDIVDSGGQTAVTRGVNGMIPRSTPNENQVTITLTEWHSLQAKTNFNIFASQGDGRKKLRDTAMAVMNRKIDDDIIAALATATTTGVNGAVTLAQVTANIAKLGRQDVEVDNPSDIVVLASLSMRQELTQLATFISHDYVDIKPLVGPTRKVLQWAGATWVFSNRLPGAGTGTETAFMFHRSALGHAVNTTEMAVVAGYNEEQDYSFCRSTQYMGSLITQQKGVLKFTHDGSAIG